MIKCFKEAIFRKAFNYFNKNNIQDKVRENLVEQEAVLKLLENKIHTDYIVEILKDNEVDIIV